MRVLIGILTILAVVAVCRGRTITVDDDGPADFSTIQAGIDDSNDGDTVLVADGTYTGDGNRDIDFLGKAITVKSENGAETCVIDCRGSEAEPHRAFNFRSGENRDSAVIGFMITNAYAPGEDCIPMPPFICSHLGGAILCQGSSPAISHCIITGNWSEQGGGIYCEEGAPSISHCTIAGNYARERGGGMMMHMSYSEITHCIVWGNIAPVDPEIHVSGYGWMTFAYSDIPGGWSGLGNIDADPCFADPGYWDPNGTEEDANDDYWVAGDYHVKSQGGRWGANEGGWTTDEVTSPCIDVGNPMTPIGLEPFPNGGRINMGGYGGTAEASKSYFGEPPCESIVAGDINGDCIINFEDFRLLGMHWCEDNSASSDLEPRYVFVPDAYALETSGGFAGQGQGIRSIEGWFELTVDLAAGTAEFSRVDATLSSEVGFYDLGGGGFVTTDDLNRLFSMTELVSTDVNDTAIDFVLERGGAPYTDIRLRATFTENSVHLAAYFCDPCCDLYCFHLDAVAVREP